jgi:hypothetical protein
VRRQIAQRGIGFESQVHDSTANLGYPENFADRANRDFSTAQIDTFFAGAKLKEKASVCCARNDKFCGGADDKFTGVLTTGSWRC